MKKVTALYLILAVILALAGCSGSTGNAAIDYGTSECFTKEDLDAAVGIVKRKFSTFDGCVLHSLSYAGDAASSEELERRNASGSQYTACIVLDSSFRSPARNSGAWEPDTEYTWRWHVAKDAGGSWTLVGYGYG